MSTALVLGGGFAGVLAARALADRGAAVTLVESGSYPDGPHARTGVPQAHHNHVLVTGGARALDTLLPGTTAELLSRGAHRRGLTGDALIRSADGWFPRHPSGADVLSCSRWLLDHVVRERALAGPGVTVRTGARAVALTGDRGGVTGAVLAGGETVHADLVVDATGRRSRTPHWLTAIGCPAPPEDTVDVGLIYCTRVYRAPAALAAGMPAIMLHPRGPDTHGATLFPIEDGRWIVTLTGSRTPADPAGFTAAARALDLPLLTALLAAAVPLGGVRPFRATANRRRHYEHRPVPGLLVLGDALAAMNPVHSHGMSAAALGILAVRGAAGSVRDTPLLQSLVANEVERPWRMAIARDRPAGDRPAPVLPAALRSRLLADPVLSGRMFREQALLPPGPARAATGSHTLLDTDDAIAQHPGLCGWWRERHAAHSA
jgi:flavin-dependent dehydrogenase